MNGGINTQENKKMRNKIANFKALNILPIAAFCLSQIHAEVMILIII